MTSQLQKFSIALVAFILCTAVSAQTIFYEDFSNNGFDNWTPQGEGIDNWDVIPTVFSQGEEPEVVMYGGPPFTGSARLVSPIINTSGHTELNLSFLHFINAGSGEYWLSVETTSDGGTTWNQVWELHWDSNINLNELVSVNIDNADVGSDNFQMAFKFMENSTLINGWVFDNISLNSGIITTNVGVSELLGLENAIYEADVVNISSTVQNYGADTANFDVKLEISDGVNIVYETTENISGLLPDEETQVDFEAWTATTGFNYTATVTTLLPGDENPGNDAVNQDFNVFPTNWYCTPSADCSFGDGLDYFSFAGIENSASGCSNNGYGLFIDKTASATAGSTYTAEIISGWINQRVSIWVDFNSDYQFTNDELVLTDYTLPNSPGQINEIDITFPVDAPTVNTFMRVGVNFEADSSPNPCASFQYGEWEDYSIEVTEISGTNEVTFQITEPGGSAYEGATIDFFAMTGTSNADGEFTFTDIAEGTFPFTIATGNSDFYDVQGEVIVESSNTTVQVELLANTDVTKNLVVIEEWTGTWCADCPAASNGLEEIEAAGYDVGIIAYHNSDDYVTGNDVPRMGNFYLRSWLPSVGFNGTFAPNCDGPATESCFDHYEPFVLDQQEISSPFDVAFTNLSLENTALTGTVKVTYPGFSYAEDVRLFVVITESEIEEEWLGLTHLNYVERGMYPDFNGMAIDLEQNEEIEVDVMFSINENWNPDKMEIIAFVQDMESQHIFNGAKSALTMTNVKDVENDDKIFVYPNPVSDLVHIESSEKMVSIKVIDNVGQVLKTISSNRSKHQIDVSHLHAGIYTIQIDTESGTSLQRIIIQ